jgi:hypothetical protein
MSTHWVALAVAVLALAGGPALAATTSADKCTRLEKQFDQAIAKHEKADKAADAKTLRTEAATLCTSGKPDDGVAKLHEALNDLGVKPRY